MSETKQNNSILYVIEEGNCLPNWVTFEIKDGKIISMRGQSKIKDAKQD